MLISCSFLWNATVTIYEVSAVFQYFLTVQTIKSHLSHNDALKSFSLVLTFVYKYLIAIFSRI